MIYSFLSEVLKLRVDTLNNFSIFSALENINHVCDVVAPLIEGKRLGD